MRTLPGLRVYNLCALRVVENCVARMKYNGIREIGDTKPRIPLTLHPGYSLQFMRLLVSISPRPRTVYHQIHQRVCSAWAIEMRQFERLDPLIYSVHILRGKIAPIPI